MSYIQLTYPKLLIAILILKANPIKIVVTNLAPKDLLNIDIINLITLICSVDIYLKLPLKFLTGTSKI